MADVVETFLQVMMSNAGKTSSQMKSWLMQYGGSYNSGKWCADYVSACAGYVGILNSVIAKSSGAKNLVLNTRNLGGKAIDPSASLLPGDLIYWGKISGSHVSVVVQDVSSQSVKTVGGNEGDKVKINPARNKNNIKYVTRPDWSRAKNYTYTPGQAISYASSGNLSGVKTMPFGEDSSAVYGVQSLYSSSPTRQDALLRQVGYLTNSNNKSIRRTNTAISVINYTGMLSQMWDKTMLSSGDIINPSDSLSDYNTSLNGISDDKIKTFISYFMSKGLGPAAVCGIAGNIKVESNFKTTATNGSHWGLAQWGGSRFTQMKSFAGSDWNSNFSGQMDFIWYELNGSYRKVLTYLKEQPNTEDGARKSAIYFARYYEVVVTVPITQVNNTEYKSRGNNAVNYFNSMKNNILTSDEDTFAI